MNNQRISTIVDQLRPQVKAYLDRLVRAESWVTTIVHQTYNDLEEVSPQNCFYLGVFYNFLVRRETYFLSRDEARYELAESYRHLLREFDQSTIQINHRVVNTSVNGRHIFINRWNVTDLRAFLDSYERYKDTRNHRTEDILGHIFNTSMIHLLPDVTPTVPYHQQFNNGDNIEKILAFVSNWYGEVKDCDRPINGDFFYGEANLILKDCIMDVAVNKDEPGLNWSIFEKRAYQMIFWALGYFKQTGEERRTFKVYNPLLGKVYVLDLPELNFEQLKERLDSRPYN